MNATRFSTGMWSCLILSELATGWFKVIYLTLAIVLLAMDFWRTP